MILSCIMRLAWQENFVTQRTYNCQNYWHVGQWCWGVCLRGCWCGSWHLAALVGVDVVADVDSVMWVQYVLTLHTTRRGSTKFWHDGPTPAWDAGPTWSWLEGPTNFWHVGPSAGDGATVYVTVVRWKHFAYFGKFHGNLKLNIFSRKNMNGTEPNNIAFISLTHIDWDMFDWHKIF